MDARNTSEGDYLMDPAQEPALDELGELKRRLEQAEIALKALSTDAPSPNNHKPTLPTKNATSLIEEPYRSLFENMTEGCALHEIICDEVGKPCDYRFLEINPAFERLTGLTRQAAIGKLATQVLPGLEPFWIDTYGQVALTGLPVQFDHFTQSLNRYFRVYAYSPAPRTFAAIFMDITDQKLVELQLNEVAEKYFTLFNATSDGVWIHDLRGVILEVNDAYCQMSGYSRDELLNMPISLLEATQSPADIAARIHKLLTQEGHDHYESRHHRKNGSIFDVDITALYFDLEGGRIAIFARDITARKQEEKRLAYLASFPERNPNPIVEADMQGRIIYINPTAQSLFPDMVEQGLSHPWFTDWETVTAPFRLGQRELIVRDVVVGDHAYQNSLSYILPEGLVRVYGIDITERKRVEEAVRLSEAKYRTIVETAAEGIVLVSSDGLFIYSNQRMADMLGYSVEELLGKPTVNFMFEDSQVRVQLMRNGLNQGDIVSGEIKFRRSDGSILWTVFNAAPLFNEKGEHIANLALHTDNTNHRQSEEALRASEQRLSRAEQLAHLGSWELDLVTGRLTWSDEVYRLFGYQPQEFPVTYEAFLDRIHPEDRQSVDAAYTSSLQDGRDTYEIEHRVINHSTGEVLYVYEKCAHFRDETGKIIRSEGMVHDITERKMADQALRRSRDELELRVQERTHTLKLTNDQLTEEVLQREKAQTELESNVQELQVIEEELRNNNELLVDAQKILEGERIRYQDLFDFSPDGYLVTDPLGQVQVANHVATEQLHVPHKRLVGKPLLVFINPADRLPYNQLLSTLQSEPGSKSLELRFLPRNAPEFTAAVKVAAARDETGKDTLRWTIRDVSERKRAEAIIRQNSLRNAVLSEVSQSLAEASLDESAIFNIVVKTTARLVGDACVVSLASPDGLYLDPLAWFHRRTDAGELMTSMFGSTRHSASEGISGKVFQTSRSVLVQDLTNPVSNTIFSASYQPYVDQVGVSSLIIVPLQLGSQTIGTLGVTRDTGGAPYTPDDQVLLEILAGRTAQSIHNARLYQELQKSLENELETHGQLVQAEKFAAVGRLLASITHEINNPLQTIKNCLYLCQEDIAPDSPISEYLSMASAETNRLSNLVAQLREIYRPPAQRQKKPVDLPTLVSEVQTLLAGYLQEKHVSWIQQPPDDGLSPHLTVDVVPDQLKQVFLNLSLNAIDAMEPLGGSITISFFMSDDGTRVGTRLSDNGPGIPPEVMDKLFEPFITSKEKGLGLGLVICYDILKKHDGSIDVESEPGAGAAFTVWLPVRTVQS